MSKSLLAKLKQNSKIAAADIMSESKFFKNRKNVKIDVHALNVALSGELDSGLESGILMLAGPSKHFKTNFGLTMAAAYMKKFPESVMLFYDSEFGAALSYFKSFGIDVSRVHHAPIKNIEELKFDIISQLEGLDEKDDVILFIDSVGNVASKKEVEDAINEKAVADMTRAKALKGLFRMITPYLTIKDIPGIVINHTYKEQTMYPRDIVSGGTGAYYSSSAIWIIGRQQDKDEDGINGYNFVINIEKSRKVREKSKIPIYVAFKSGIERYSALLEWALDGKFITKPKVGWYQVHDPISKEPLPGLMREADTYNGEVWKPLLASAEFKDFIRNKFQLAVGQMIRDEDDATE